MISLQKAPFITLGILILLTLLIWIYRASYTPIKTQYQLRSSKLPGVFDGFTIAQVSDFHNQPAGNQTLLAMLAEAKPDLIAVTGDLIDSRRTNVAISVQFIREAVKIAPVYYVPGNHEGRIPVAYAELKTALSKLGVVILENENAIWEQGTDTVTITGLLDPRFHIPWPELPSRHYRIVLSHRPELFAQYVERGFDLVLTGHAHGGQFRLPLIGGVFAPQQGLLPKYTAGIHVAKETSMIVSRGLGNAPIIPRINNRPELVLITLESL